MERAFCPQTFEYDHDLISGETTGVVLHYQDPENFMAFGLEHVTGTTMKPRLMRRKDGEFASLATGSNFTLTSGDRVRVAIKDDPGNSALQKLEVYVAGTSRFASTAIDDDWSAGLAGFYVRSGQTSTVTFDNCKIGIDNNADDDCDDAGDDVQIDDDFASSVVNLTYDNNGNMTDDGILKFVYDAWNRMVKAKRRVDAETVIATYSYDGATRRTKKIVANQGVEVVANDGGNTTANYYFDRRQHLVETRNGSNQTTAHYVWGTGRDELLLAEINGDVTIGNDSNPDVTASGEGAESPSDKRYYAMSSREGQVLALTEYDAAATANGRAAERYVLSSLAVVLAISGDSGDGESGAISSQAMLNEDVISRDSRRAGRADSDGNLMRGGLIPGCPATEPKNGDGSALPGDNWCFDNKGGGHCGLRCYRSYGTGTWGGQQCCYNIDGTLNTDPSCMGSIDLCGPAEGENADGTCDFAWIIGVPCHWWYDVPADDTWWGGQDYADEDRQIQCCLRYRGIPSGSSGQGVTDDELRCKYKQCRSNVQLLGCDYCGDPEDLSCLCKLWPSCE